MPKREPRFKIFPTPEERKLNMVTEINGGVIQTTLERQIGEKIEALTKWAMDTREAQVEEALRRMGWVPPGGGWIALADRKPKFGQRVFISDGPHVCCASRARATTILRDMEYEPIDVWADGFDMAGVELGGWNPTHWMPLPEPPKA